MICFTCDIHNASLKIPYQSYADKSELQVTQMFLKLLEKYGVKATIFITGKCFTEEIDDVMPICNHPLVEVGGHNYYCFQPEIWHRFWGKTIRNYSGPRWYQRYDIKKTRDIIYDKTGYKLFSWRNHMFIHGRNTESILSKLGIKICADEVKASGTGPVWHKKGIFNFPVNIMPDFDHLYHANRTEESISKWLETSKWSDDFGSESYYINQWTDIVLDQLKEKVDQDIIVNMLIHPLSHYICDKFENIERILKFIGSNKNCFYNELPLEHITK